MPLNMVPQSGTDRKKKKKKTLEVQVEVYPEQKERTAPFVGYFPSGFDPLKGTPSENNPKIRAYRSTEPNRTGRVQLVVSPAGSNVDFVGTNYLGESALPRVCTYALGVLDKENQSLKIVPIAGNKILRLEPRVRGVKYIDAEPEELKEGEILTSETRATQMRALTEAFGSRQSKIKIKKLDQAKLKEDDLGADVGVERMIEDVGKHAHMTSFQEVREHSNASVARNIPPHDATATIPENAYLLDKIILKGEHDYLFDVLELSQSGSNADLSSISWGGNAYPSFVRNRVHRLRDIEDQEEKKKLAFIFSYISHLVRFLDLPSQSLKDMLTARSTLDQDLVDRHSIPRVLFEKFVKLFVDSESRAISNEKRELLISYVLVLTLFVDGFGTEPSDIAKDLRMTLPSLRPYYHQLGCKNKQSLMTLRVPLQFPPIRRGRKRR